MHVSVTKFSDTFTSLLLLVVWCAEKKARLKQVSQWLSYLVAPSVDLFSQMFPLRRKSKFKESQRRDRRRATTGANNHRQQHEKSPLGEALKSWVKITHISDAPLRLSRKCNCFLCSPICSVHLNSTFFLFWLRCSHSTMLMYGITARIDHALL